MYLVVKGNTNKSYYYTNTCDKPRLVYKNNGITGYIPLTNKTSMSYSSTNVSFNTFTTTLSMTYMYDSTYTDRDTNGEQIKLYNGSSTSWYSSLFTNGYIMTTLYPGGGMLSMRKGDSGYYTYDGPFGDGNMTNSTLSNAIYEGYAMDIKRTGHVVSINSPITVPCGDMTAMQCDESDMKTSSICGVFVLPVGNSSFTQTSYMKAMSDGVMHSTVITSEDKDWDGFENAFDTDYLWYTVRYFHSTRFSFEDVYTVFTKHSACVASTTYAVKSYSSNIVTITSTITNPVLKVSDMRCMEYITGVQNSIYNDNVYYITYTSNISYITSSDTIARSDSRTTTSYHNQSLNTENGKFEVVTWGEYTLSDVYTYTWYGPVHTVSIDYKTSTFSYPENITNSTESYSTWR